MFMLLHCKDCKYYDVHPDDRKDISPDYISACCRWCYHGMVPYDYCSFGESYETVNEWAAACGRGEFIDGDYTPKEREDSIPKQSLEEFLDSIVGIQILSKADRQAVVEKFNITQNGRLCGEYAVLAAWLEDSGLPYRLLKYAVPKTTDKGKTRRLQAWQIYKLKILDQIEEIQDER